ncbi:hypothetical protein C8J56DRAFT_44332 [Mycena floridula]|nr:hypothetical protein C8J56DRAFT_44332 [Mycena floridula]
MAATLVNMKAQGGSSFLFSLSSCLFRLVGTSFVDVISTRSLPSFLPKLRWLVEGSPRVLLFDTGSMYRRLDEWKGDLWNLAAERPRDDIRKIPNGLLLRATCGSW